MNSGLQQFAQAVQRTDEAIELEVAAFLLGAIAADGPLDLAHFQHQLDQFSELARQEQTRLENTPWAPLRALGKTLFAELKFRGNNDDYYDPRNSFLHQVIERRLGIPITLSVLYLAVARRLGMAARGVGFPGHFLVRVEADSATRLVDPFHGGLELDDAALIKLLERRNGPGARLEPAMLEPISNKALLTRMLFNLSGIYGQRNDWSRSLAVLERLALLDPENQRIARELIDLRARVRTLN